MSGDSRNGARVGVNSDITTKVNSSIHTSANKHQTNTSNRGGAGGASQVKSQGGHQAFQGGATHATGGSTHIMFPAMYHQNADTLDLSKNDLRLILKQQAMVGKSAFGDFWIPSFAMSVMVSVGVTLLILTLWWCMGNTMDQQCTKARRKMHKSATKMFGNGEGADGSVKTAIVNGINRQAGPPELSGTASAMAKAATALEALTAQQTKLEETLRLQHLESQQVVQHQQQIIHPPLTFQPPWNAHPLRGQHPQGHQGQTPGVMDHGVAGGGTSAMSIPRDKHAAGISNLMRTLRRSWIQSGGSGAPDAENQTGDRRTTPGSRPGTTPGEPTGPTTGAETGVRLFNQQQLDEALLAQLSMLHTRARQADEEVKAEEEAKAQEGAAAAAAAAPVAANTRKRGVYSTVFDQLLELGD